MLFKIRLSKILSSGRMISANLKNWIYSIAREYCEVLFAIALFLIAIIVIKYFLRVYKLKESFGELITGGSFAIAFDILIFGIVLILLNKRLDKSRLIRRWEEEIDDYRDWKSEEAKYRLVGLIKRINKKGKSRINLSDCYLKKAKLSNINIVNSVLFKADLSDSEMFNIKLNDADLSGATLDNAQLQGAKMENAKLYGASLIGADLSRANLRNTKFGETILHSPRGGPQLPTLERAYLVEADFSNSRIEYAKFGGAILASIYKCGRGDGSPLCVDFSGAELVSCDFRGVRVCEHGYNFNTRGGNAPNPPEANEILVSIFAKSKGFKDSLFDMEVEIELKKKYNAKFKKPKE